MKMVTRQRRYDLTLCRSLGAARRRVVALLGLFILAFNILGAGAMPATAQSPLARGLEDGRIVVCTATGMVVMDKDGTILDGDAGAGQSDLCVFCLPLMHGGAKAPAVQALVFQVQLVAVDNVGSVAPSMAPSARLDGAASPRAPPIA